MHRTRGAQWRRLLPLLLAAVAGCGGTPAITTCDAAAGIEPDCRFRNPEDMVASPGGSHLLVSQMGSMDGSRAGNLVAYDPDSGSIETLFPRPDRPLPSRTEGWGDPACAAPDPSTFSPHGIDLETLNGGEHALYVVNHGGRESVEMFQVEDVDGVPALTWRGCTVAPEGGYFNDLVVLRDGGFWVSHMFPRDANILWSLLRMQVLGHEPGHAYAWEPGDGFTKIPGSDVAFANGVEKSSDERVLFLNSYFGEAVVALDVTSGERLASVAVASPDNLAWAPGGELLAASHHASLADTMACQDLERGNCGFRFQIVAIDADDWSQRVVLDQEGPPMGAATVAVPYEGHIYLGTFAGDRIARTTMKMSEQ